MFLGPLSWPPHVLNLLHILAPFCGRSDSGVERDKSHVCRVPSTGWVRTHCSGFTTCSSAGRCGAAEVSTRFMTSPKTPAKEPSRAAAETKPMGSPSPDHSGDARRSSSQGVFYGDQNLNDVFRTRTNKNKIRIFYCKPFTAYFDHQSHIGQTLIDLKGGTNKPIIKKIINK